MRTVRTILVVALPILAAPSGMVLPWPALAQVPSTESLIRQLRPREEPSGTRGVLRIGPQGTASPVERAAARPEATLQVRFGFDSAQLTPQAIEVLDNLGRALSSPSLALYRFRLVGHTDAQGTEAYNVNLSQRRAEAVRAYLMERWNVDSSRLVPEGRGFRELVDKSNPLSPANRRVQVINEGPAG
jgi:OOP family OmpA-OmpF porin